MSLDAEALASLAGAAALSMEEARLILDETCASAQDVESLELRPVWALFESRIRGRQQLDTVVIRESLRGSSDVVRAIASDAVRKPSLGTARERLTLLRETGVRRRLVEALRECAIAVKGGRPLAEVDALLRAAPVLMHGVGSRVRNARGDALAMRDHLESQWAGVGVPQLRMGFGAVDEVVGGLINNLIVIGARTGVGKSAVVAGLVRNWLTDGHKVGVLAYEDDAKDMAARIVACEAGVELKEARGDKTPDGAHTERQERLAQITSGLEWYSRREHLLEVDDARPSGSASDVVASIRTMAARGCRAVLLDNMTCVRLDGPDDRRHDLMLERALADIRGEAQALRIPVLVVGHIKRGSDGSDESMRAPRLSDFSNASAWENYARVALGLWRDSDDGICLRVLKQTNGPAGDDFDVQIRKEAAVVTGTTWRATKRQAPRRRYGDQQPPKPYDSGSDP